MRATGLAVCVVVLMMFAGGVSAAEDDARLREVARLLREIPTPARLDACKRLLLPAGTETGARSQTEAQQTAEREQAKATLERAKAAIPALRKLLKPGTSVFDYPGLLAHGAISYDEHTKTYESYMGFYPRQLEGREPYDFLIVFDSTGQILAVHDVTHKR
jgi:hypothetical protein